MSEIFFGKGWPMIRQPSLELPSLIIDEKFYSDAKAIFDGRFLVVSTASMLGDDAGPEECAQWFAITCPSEKVLVVTRPMVGKDALLKSQSHRAGYGGLIVSADIETIQEIETLADSSLESGKWRVVSNPRQFVEGWPAIKPDEQDSPPEPFPIDSLPLPAQRFCRAVSVAQGVDIGFSAVFAISVMAAAIGASHQVEIKSGWVELPVLWLGLVSRPGTGKSPAMQAAFAPLRKIQKELSETFRGKMSQYKDDIARWKKNGDYEIPAKPIRQGIICSNITVESLICELGASPRGMVLASDELAFWLQNLNAYKAVGGDRQWWLSTWSSIPLDYHRRNLNGETVFLNRPFLGLCGGIQPDKVGLLAGTDDGLISRFLLAAPLETRGRYSRDGLCKESQKGWSEFIQGLWEMAPESSTFGEMVPNTVTLAEDTHDAFELFANGVIGELAEDSMPEILRGSWSKASTMAARLALVIHCGKVVSGEESNPEEVSKETMEQAIELVQYFLAHLLRLVPSFDAGATKQEKIRQRILSHIKRKRNSIRLDGGKMEWTSLRHAMRRGLTDSGGHIDDRLMDQVIQGLVTTGHLRMGDRVSDTGRPLKPSIQVNPHLLFGG